MLGRWIFLSAVPVAGEPKTLFRTLTAHTSMAQRPKTHEHEHGTAAKNTRARAWHSGQKHMSMAQRPDAHNTTA